MEIGQWLITYYCTGVFMTKEKLRKQWWKHYKKIATAPKKEKKYILNILKLYTKSELKEDIKYMK